MKEEFELCGRCGGSGKMDHPAFSNGVEPELMEDPEFEEEYFSGRYDVTCSECDGLRVVKVYDPEAEGHCESCGLRMYSYSYQEYPGAYTWTEYECRNRDCDGE